MAKPSSSTSNPSARGIFGFLARGEAFAATSDRAWLAAMLDFEAALARAEARAGVIPNSAAEAIGSACGADGYDADEIGEEAATTGNPAAPLVRALTREVASVDAEAAGFVHLGATSQDVMDTAAVLVTRRAFVPLRADLAAPADAAAAFARTNRSTLMLARTLLQHALPTTFGFVAAGWLAGLDRAVERLGAVAPQLTVQLGGAAGTLASLGDRGVAVLEFLAADLHLAVPPVPWHAERTRIAEVASVLALAAGACSKVALDVVLLAQSDVAEVRETGAGRGGSSTLPQKRNPVAAISSRAAAAQAPGLAATLFAAMPQELQRGAGTWQAEWQPLTLLLRSAGSSAAWLRESLEHLEVDAARMRSNLDAAGGFPLSERIATELAPSLGRSAAHSLVEEIAARAVASGASLHDALLDDPRIASAVPRGLDGVFDPAGYLGSAGEFVERALAEHERVSGR